MANKIIHGASSAFVHVKRNNAPEQPEKVELRNAVVELPPEPVVSTKPLKINWENVNAKNVKSGS